TARPRRSCERWPTTLSGRRRSRDRHACRVSAGGAPSAQSGTLRCEDGDARRASVARRDGRQHGPAGDAAHARDRETMDGAVKRRELRELLALLRRSRDEEWYRWVADGRPRLSDDEYRRVRRRRSRRAIRSPQRAAAGTRPPTWSAADAAGHPADRAALDGGQDG